MPRPPAADGLQAYVVVHFPNSEDLAGQLHLVLQEFAAQVFSLLALANLYLAHRTLASALTTPGHPAPARRSRPTDVASSERHTVKPWIAVGELDTFARLFMSSPG
jgi:hypothetical protein